MWLYLLISQFANSIWKNNHCQRHNKTHNYIIDGWAWEADLYALLHRMSSFNDGIVITAWLPAGGRSICGWLLIVRWAAEFIIIIPKGWRRIDSYPFLKLFCGQQPHLHIIIGIYFISSGLAVLRRGVPAAGVITHCTTAYSHMPMCIIKRYSLRIKCLWRREREGVWHFSSRLCPSRLSI